MIMIWITVLLIIGIQVIPIGKTSQKNYLEQVLSQWIYKLMKLNAIDKNWLTSSSTECMDMIEFVSGNCVSINHMENDSKVQKQLFETSSAFYILCYTLVRRFLEIFSLYMARWLPLICLCTFFASGTLVALYHLNKNSMRWTKKENVSLSRSWIVTFVGFSLSSLSILSVILPVVADYILGEILDKELESFQEEAQEYAIERVLRRERSRVCCTLQGFYDFRCLRKTMFDLGSSGLQELSTEHLTLYEKLCLQIQIAVINGITLLASCILYGVPVILLYVIIRLCKRKMEYPIPRLNKSSDFEKIARNLKRSSLPVNDKEISEQCNKKTLEPGMRNPWQELSFSTNIEDHLERFIKEENEFKDSELLYKKGERQAPVIHRTQTLKWLKYTPYVQTPRGPEKILCPVKGPKRNLIEKPLSVKRPRIREDTQEDKVKPTTGYDTSRTTRESTRNNRMEKTTLSPSKSVREVKIKPTVPSEEIFDDEIFYNDAGTNVCFDTDDDSDSSDLSSDQ